MSRRLWGEFTNDGNDDAVQNVNFNPIIELGMQNIPEIPITVKSSPIELPQANLITHTIQLHVYARQLSNILELSENTVIEGPLSLPGIPAQPERTLKLEHKAKPAIHFLEKEYCDFALGKGHVILPFTPESHKRALKQCAAIAIAHVGIPTATNTALEAVADALDIYMKNICKLLRSVVDREASGLRSGFPDAISKVFSDLQVGDLHEFYENRIVRYHARMKQKCENLQQQCEAQAVKDITPQLKLEEVPELHFPAALDGSFTPSLETGYQMLQNLEQEQLEGLEFIEIVGQDVKLEAMDFVQPDLTTKPSSLSPNSKKKRK